MSTKSPLAPDHRRRELAQIHMAKAQLSVADEVYRGIILAISNGATDSSGQLDWQGRKMLIEHFVACGFKSTSKSKPAALFPDTPKWKKIWSLWQKLADQGKVKSRGASALVSFCKHQTGVDRTEWMTESHLYSVIEALKSWGERNAP